MCLILAVLFPVIPACFLKGQYVGTSTAKRNSFVIALELPGGNNSGAVYAPKDTMFSNQNEGRRLVKVPHLLVSSKNPTHQHMPIKKSWHINTHVKGMRLLAKLARMVTCAFSVYV